MAKTQKQGFLHGAAILTASVVIVKAIGALYKIPLSNLIGEEGMGHFNVAYSIFTLLLVIVTYGLPIAISKLISDSVARGRQGEVKKVLGIALRILIIAGGAASLGMFAFHNEIAAAFKDEAASLSIMVLAPAIFLASIVSAYRGYFQGLSNMTPTAVSQVIEALCKLGFGLTFAYLLKSYGATIEWVVAGSILGVVLGSLFSCVYMIIKYIRHRKSFPPAAWNSGQNWKEVTLAFLGLAIPITICSLVMSLANFFDSMIVMRRLQEAIGMTEKEAAHIYGSYGFAQNLYLLPGNFVGTLSVSVIPAITEALALNNVLMVRKTSASAVKLMFLLTLPAGVGISVLAGPILGLLYPLRPEGVAIATLPLTILGYASVLTCIAPIYTSMMQAHGKVFYPLIALFAGGSVKVVTTWMLVGNPEIGINGAAVSTTFCYLTITVINIILYRVTTREAPNILGIMIKPVLATAVMGATAWAVYGIASRYIDRGIATVTAILAGAAVYFVMVVALRILTKDDVEFMPRGEKIAKFLKIS